MYIKCLLFLFYIGLIEGTGSGYSSRLTGSCPTPTLENGKVRMRQKSRLVKFTCNFRYKIVGSKYASCRNGEWDEPLPVCIRPGCNVTSIENGLYIEQADEAWIAYFCFPGYTLVGSPILYCDGKTWNASAPTCADKSQPSRLSCDFESRDLCGWTQDELHDFDWKRLNKKTPSSFLFTGPSFDHTLGIGHSGYYMYIESTSRLLNDTARLLSPIYDKALAKNGCFKFFYHMYGLTCGGLRVYQKPDRLGLLQLLKLPDSQKKNYTLFERWGNVGDLWLPSLSNLTDFDDNFQIVIEGIRGTSFTSDIAIDDVAILQGENCTIPNNGLTTPKVLLFDSCRGRCNTSDDSEYYSDLIDLDSVSGLCGCSWSCLTAHTCCADFYDACIFPDIFPQYKKSEIVPQTQKLIASKSDTTSTSTTTKTTTVKPTTKTTTTTTTTTTPKPTTARKPTTVQKTTTTPKPTTTRKPTTTQKTTTTTMKTTTRKIITSKPILKTTQRPTTARTTTKTTKLTTFSTPSTTKITTTTLPTATTDKREIQQEIIDKAKKEKNIEYGKTIKDTPKGPQPGSSKGKVAAIIIGVMTCLLGVIWVGYVARSAWGRIALTRLRGRIGNDAEVRFLSANMDDY